MKESLTDVEIAKIEAFCADKVMFDAVKKVILEGIYFQGTIKKGLTPNPLINGALSLASLSTGNPIPDEELGANIRGIWAGLNALENAYKKLETIKRDDGSVISEYNEAI